MTSIEWTEQTWNPIVGCSVTSPGCTNCYAMKMAHRLASNPATPHYHGTTQMTRGGPVFTGKVSLAPEKVLTAPLRRKKPTTYFVNSMGDLFHENVPDEWIDKVFAVMALCPQHRFQVLTKRADRMRKYLTNHEVGQRWAEATDTLIIDFIPVVFPEVAIAWTKHGLPNVWLGVSAEDQARWNERWPHLARTPAAIRFISAEPLLGPVDMIGAGKLDWVIVGGESGPGARAMHPDWARSLRDQCQEAGTAFFFKQWGAWWPISQMQEADYKSLYKPVRKAQPHEEQDIINDLYGEICTVDELCLQLDGNHRPILEVGAWGHGAMQAFKTGKKAAGRLLDGREWNYMPEGGGV